MSFSEGNAHRSVVDLFWPNPPSANGLCTPSQRCNLGLWNTSIAERAAVEQLLQPEVPASEELTLRQCCHQFADLARSFATRPDAPPHHAKRSEFSASPGNAYDCASAHRDKTEAVLL
jgi:hypothetical protein